MAKSRRPLRDLRRAHRGGGRGARASPAAGLRRHGCLSSPPSRPSCLRRRGACGRLVMRNDGQSAVSVPPSSENTLVRIDPATNAISASSTSAVDPRDGGRRAQRLGLQPMPTHDHGDRRRDEQGAADDAGLRDPVDLGLSPGRAGGRLGGRMDRRRRPEREAAPHADSLERTRETRVPPRPRAPSGRGRARRRLGRSAGALATTRCCASTRPPATSPQRTRFPSSSRIDVSPSASARSGSCLVHRDALPDQPSLGSGDGAHRPRGTRRPARSPVRQRLGRGVGASEATLSSTLGRSSSNGSTAAFPRAKGSTWSTGTARSGSIDWPAGTVVRWDGETYEVAAISLSRIRRSMTVCA